MSVGSKTNHAASASENPVEAAHPRFIAVVGAEKSSQAAPGNPGAHATPAISDRSSHFPLNPFPFPRPPA